MSTKVSYNGNEILNLSTDGTATLNTKGKFCEEDIVIESTGGEMPEEYAIGGSYAGKTLTGYHFSETANITEMPVFNGCANLLRIDIPSSVHSFAFNSIFANCTQLQSLIFPSIITSWGNYICQNCKSLKTVVINSNNLTSLGNYTFRGCSSIELFDFRHFMRAEAGTVKTTITWSTFDDVLPADAKIVFGSQIVAEAYSLATNWSNYAENMYYDDGTGNFIKLL